MKTLTRIATEELNRPLGSLRVYVHLGTEAETGAA